MQTPNTFAALRSMSDEELIALYDELRPGVWLGPDLILEELTRRSTDRVSDHVVLLTRVAVAIGALSLLTGAASIWATVAAN